MMTLSSKEGYTLRKDGETMSAYLITDVEITAPALYGQFLEQMTPTVDSYGGRFIVRGGGIEAIWGDWAPKRLAILEFDSTERAKSWLSSPEFTALDEIRTKSSNIKMIIVEGL